MANKKYVDKLTKWVDDKKKKTKRDQHLISFLAVKSDVIDALNTGYSVKTIWEHLSEQGSITCTYHTFLNYVNKSIKDKESEDQEAVEVKEKLEEKSKSQESKPEETSEKKKTGFSYNPNPNKKDLF